MRTPIRLLLTALALQACAAAQGKASAQIRDPAFLEIDVEDRPYYVHELIPVTVRFGFEQQFMKRNMIQMFTRRLDVPAQLEAAWIDNLAGAIALPEHLAQTAAKTGRRLRFVLNESIGTAKRVADREIKGRSFVVLELQRTYLAQRAGTLEITATKLHFRHASEFEEDFDGRMIPKSPQGAVVSSEPLSIRIVTTPVRGQPLDFDGAVGNFQISASATPLTLDAGSTLKLKVTIEGVGNLHQLTPPDLSGLTKLHLLGKSEAEPDQPQKRSLTYDLVPVDATLRAIPPISLSFFDPRPPAQYRTVRTEAIPLKVRATAGSEASAPPPAKTPGLDDIFGLKSVTLGGNNGSLQSRTVRGLILVGPWLLVLALWGFRRRQAHHRAPKKVRERGALNRFRQALADGETTTALVDYLAARLHCNPAAVVTPELAARLESAGLAEPLAAQTALTLERLVAASYGGVDATKDADSLAELAFALDAAFQKL